MGAARIVRFGEKIRLHSKHGSALTELLVTALQDGSEADVIRLRSTLGPAILWGRLLADGSAELVFHPGGDLVGLQQAEVGW